MDYSKKYINFINGRYTAEGVRVAAGILFPSLLMYYYGFLSIGISMSIGALCIAISDTPGPVKHRLNGMLACCMLVLGSSVLVNYASVHPVLLGCIIIAEGFLFSMLTVYGNRSSAIGVASMFIMVLSLKTPLSGVEIWINAGYTLAGGVWYMLYSLSLYRLRPYKFIQQVLADYVTEVGSFLRLRGSLYQKNPNYEQIQEQLLQQQISIEAQQNTLSDLFLNTRTIVKESTNTGRILVKTYLEVTELYSSVMTTFQAYAILHEQFDDTDILEEYKAVILSLSQELEEISLALRSGLSSTPNSEKEALLKKAGIKFESLRQHYMSNKNVEHFVSLGRILKNLEDLAEKINRLHLYSTYAIQLKKGNTKDTGIESTIPVKNIRPSLFFDNLNVKSNIFRHALRVALALLLGYIASLFFNVDHGYWILLTIVVILKPAYALSKRRNTDRLIGTLIGIIIGLFLLYFIKNDTILLVLMVMLMMGSFMFIRTNYFMSVLLMTPYLLIVFHFLFPGNLNDLMLERFIDTAIGSVIAFFASLFLVPAWEKTAIRSYMKQMLKSNAAYYAAVAVPFTGLERENASLILVTRREVLIALANLSDAFTRMLSEPKRFQQGTKTVHRFVSLNHTLTAHLATLSFLLQTEKNLFRWNQLQAVIDLTQQYLQQSMALLEEQPLLQKPDHLAMKQMNERVTLLLEKRRQEIEAGNLETHTKKDLVETKSITDQFNNIFSDVLAIYNVSKEYQLEHPPK